MTESGIEERHTHVNPVALEDAATVVTATARRLLDYERYLDALEHQKMRDESLPPAVEQRVGRSIQGNLADADLLCSRLLELTSELADVGAFEALFSSFDERVEPGGLPKAIEEASGSLEGWLEQRGLPLGTFRWAAQYAEWVGVGARAEAGSIVLFRGDRQIAVISPTPDPDWDAASFVARAYGLPPSIRRADDDDRPLRVSAPELVDVVVRELLTFYRRRARRTAMDGVQVLKTGIWWIVVILVIAIILVVAGASILILCAIGSLSGGICVVGAALLILGFIGLAIAGLGSGGGPPENDPDYDYDTDPDPFG